MKLPKGHILKTTVRYNINDNSIQECIGGILKDFRDFTGYIRLLGENEGHEEEIRVILNQGKIIGGQRKQIGSNTVFYGNDCNFDEPISFKRSGASVVRLTLDDIEMIKVTYPECVIKNISIKDTGNEENSREELLKKYRIKQMSDSEITNLLQKLNGD